MINVQQSITTEPARFVVEILTSLFLQTTWLRVGPRKTILSRNTKKFLKKFLVGCLTREKESVHSGTVATTRMHYLMGLSMSILGKISNLMSRGSGRTITNSR